jgi:uncharacterized protein YoxC
MENQNINPQTNIMQTIKNPADEPSHEDGLYDATTLLIKDLPESLQKVYQDMEKDLQDRSPESARKKITELLTYYKNTNREIPQEIEIAYAWLLILENPGPITGEPETQNIQTDQKQTAPKQTLEEKHKAALFELESLKETVKNLTEQTHSLQEKVASLTKKNESLTKALQQNKSHEME